MREALIFSKAEIERLKTEKIKFEVMEQQHRLDIDSKKIDLERSMIEITKEKHDEMGKINRETDNLMKKNKDDKMYWESQKVELSHKNKLYQRKIQELEERINELIQMNEELHTDNTKMSIQLDEMRSVYRGRLLQFMNEQMANGGKGRKENVFFLWYIYKKSS